MKYRLHGKQKERRDKAILYFHIENPTHTQKQIAIAFGLTQGQVSKILGKEVVNGNHQVDKWTRTDNPTLTNKMKW